MMVEHGLSLRDTVFCASVPWVKTQGFCRISLRDRLGTVGMSLRDRLGDVFDHKIETISQAAMVTSQRQVVHSDVTTIGASCGAATVATKQG